MTADQLVGHPLAYIGIPWKACEHSMCGADCWGIVRMAARGLYGLDMPDYFYTQRDLLTEASALIDNETAGPRWRALAGPGPFEAGVVHIFRIKGLKTHCGLSLGGFDFLHSLPGHNSAIESINDVQWRQRRTGSYAWRP